MSTESRPDAGRWARLRGRWSSWRDGLRHRPTADLVYRLAVGVVGTAVLIAGIIAIPYPGPGWAVVFLGLGILATEFAWARRALHWTRRRYDAVMAWLGRQPLWVRLLCGVLTAAVVLATLWLLGALSTVAALVGLHWPWLASPVGMGS